MVNKTTIEGKIQTKAYKKKLQIINYVDANKSMKLKDIAAHFSLSTSTLSDIMKNREKIEPECVSPDARATAVKRTCTVTHPDVDKAMILWFRQMSLRPDLRIDGCMLLQQANKFRLKIHPDDTTPISASWIDRFKKRYDIVRVHKAGESGEVDTEVVRH